MHLFLKLSPVNYFKVLSIGLPTMYVQNFLKYSLIWLQTEQHFDNFSTTIQVDELVADCCCKQADTHQFSIDTLSESIGISNHFEKSIAVYFKFGCLVLFLFIKNAVLEFKNHLLLVTRRLILLPINLLAFSVLILNFDKWM